MFRKDYTGKQFGFLTVIGFAGKSSDNHSLWRCSCVCGNEVTRSGRSLDASLKSKSIASCGCMHPNVAKEEDHLGERFGSLTIVGKAENKSSHSCWVCKCDCGKEIEVILSHLIARKKTDCGCSKAAIVPLTHRRLYHIWHDMKRRCTKPQNKSFKDYGGRGVTVCSEWISSYDSFEKWAEFHGYKDGLSIDRIDKDGNYEPDNCRWADNFIQANNRRNNHFIEIDGKLMSIADASRTYGVDYRLIQDRIRRGWNPQEAVFTEKGGKRGSHNFEM